MRGKDLYREQLDTLPQRYVQFDMMLAWSVGTAGGETVVEGVLKNVRYDRMEGVEVWISALDGAGATLARSVCFIIPRELRNGEIAPFAVKLPVALLPGTPLRFIYKYRGSDGGDGGSSWSQTFDSLVP